MVRDPNQIAKDVFGTGDEEPMQLNSLELGSHSSAWVAGTEFQACVDPNLETNFVDLDAESQPFVVLSTIPGNVTSTPKA